MTSRELENLASIGQLKRTTSTGIEIDALVSSGEARLKDAGNTSLALESRIDLAYNAAHDNRQTPQTTDVPMTTDTCERGLGERGRRARRATTTFPRP